MTDFTITDLNRVRRRPNRAHYDRDTVYAILDDALVCHVGFVQDGRPFVIPATHARDRDTLILHGARESRLLTHVRDGHPICVAVTILDGIVFARSAAGHSMNYRSVVLFGAGRSLTADEDKLHASEVLTEHIAPGRWADVRKPNRAELDAAAFVAIDITVASAKIRTGPPGDDEDDYALPIWAGVLPLRVQPQAVVDDPRLVPGVVPPAYIAHYRRAR
jgi:hypothetical protein